MRAPKVSVVIPCFNHGEFIDDAVESILGQTYQDLEIIIVNDGSTDGFTNDKLRTYAKTKTSILHIPNGGPSVARNSGIRTAKGEYVLTLDADDFLESAFFEKAVGILEGEKGVGVVTSGVQFIGDSNRTWYPKGGGVEDFLLENNCASGALFRMECWEEAGGYDEEMRKGYEDWDLWLSITGKGWRVHSIPEPLLFHRICKGSRDHDSYSEHPESVKRIVRNHPDLFGEYVSEVIYAKEKVISSLRKRLEDAARLEGIEASTSYKLGKTVLLPFTFMKDYLRRRKRKS